MNQEFLSKGTKNKSGCASKKKDELNPTLSVSPLSAPTVEIVLENKCCWIRNALGIQEQIEVFEDILERSKTIDNTARKTFCMNPSPKTIIFDGHTPTLRFGKVQESNHGKTNDAETATPLSSVYDRLILRRAISVASSSRFDILKRDFPPPPPTTTRPTQSTEPQEFYKSTGFGYDRYSVGVIRYAPPNGIFPEHIDHCNDPNGWVVLLSLGCTASFTVRGPGAKTPKRYLSLESGDVLFFDPSTEAAVRHGVASVVPSSCPEELVRAFGAEAMANHRYGVQCRISLNDSE